MARMTAADEWESAILAECTGGQGIKDFVHNILGSLEFMVGALRAPTINSAFRLFDVMHTEYEKTIQVWWHKLNISYVTLKKIIGLLLMRNLVLIGIFITARRLPQLLRLCDLM